MDYLTALGRSPASYRSVVKEGPPDSMLVDLETKAGFDIASCMTSVCALRH